MKKKKTQAFVYDEKGIEETRRQLLESYSGEPVKEKRNKNKEK
ncbi:hypothetical protein [Bacillus testis]|nr:hypothetical protein [Bacillus testis]